jgi:hypothetical protein
MVYIRSLYPIVFSITDLTQGLLHQPSVLRYWSLRCAFLIAIRDEKGEDSRHTIVFRLDRICTHGS